MSFEPDNTDVDNDIIGALEEMTMILKAILMGIEMIADQESGTLIQDVSNED